MDGTGDKFIYILVANQAIIDSLDIRDIHIWEDNVEVLFSGGDCENLN